MPDVFFFLLSLSLSSFGHTCPLALLHVVLLFGRTLLLPLPLPLPTPLPFPQAHVTT